MALSVSDYKEIISLTRQIKDEEKELARLKRDGKEIDKAKLENLKAQLEVRRKNNEEAETEYKSTEKAFKSASNLSKAIVGSSDDLLKRKRRIAEFDKSGVDLNLQAADALKKSGEFEEAILRTKTKSNMLNFNSKEMIEEINEQLEVINEQYADASDSQKEILDLTRDDLKLTKKKVKTMGQQTDKAKGLKAAQDKLKDLSGGYLDNIESSILMIKEMGKAISQNPTMAFAAMGVAVGQAIETAINKVKDMQQDLGLSREVARDLRREFQEIPISFEKGFFAIGPDFFEIFTGADVGKSAAGLVNEFGNLSVATEENANYVALIGKGLTISADTTGKVLANFMKIRGESMETAKKSLETAGALAIANEIPVNMLMKDIADNTETFAEFSIQGSDNIQRAAVQARRLGLNLSTTAKIANSLLDFESSIEKEMSASLLVGKQLNYNRARQLALEGNIAGATQDIMSQLGGQAGFARLNVIQRRALAESIGVSVEELSRLASGKVELKSPDVDSREKLTKSIDLLRNSLDNTLGKSGKAIFGGIGAVAGFILNAMPEVASAFTGAYIAQRGTKDVKKIYNYGAKQGKGFFGRIKAGLGFVRKDAADVLSDGQDEYIKGAKRRMNRNLPDELVDEIGSGIKNPKTKPKVTILGPDGKPIDVNKLKPSTSTPTPKTPTTPKSGGKFGSLKGKGGLLALATEGYFLADELSDSTLSTRDKTKTIVDSATGLGGAYGGAAAGAALGTALLPGIGTVVGGFIGGIGGYFAGEKIGGAAFDYGAEVLDARMEKNETTDILTKSDTENTDRVVESIDLLNLKMNEVKQEIQSLNPQRQ